MISTGKAAARELTHAGILLKADQGPYGPGYSDAEIQEALDISVGTVGRVRKRCAQAGVQEAILPQKAQRERGRLLDGKQEAYLIARVISVSIQIAVLMVSQRISAVWQRMREHAGMRGAAIEVISHLTFLQVYGLIGFVANVIGDVTFITLYTHNLVVLFLWCIFLTGSSTIVLLDGAQRLWGGFQMRAAYLRRMQQQQSSSHN